MLRRILKKHRSVGIVANQNEAKTSLALQELIDLREELNNKIKILDKQHKSNSNKVKLLKEFEIYVFGVEESLHPYLKEKGLKILLNKEDILDLKVKHSIIYIDEISIFFNPHSRNRQIDKLKRFFNRIYHLDDYLVCSTAEAGYWNKTMEGLIKCWLVKKIDFENLVTRTKLLRKVKGIENKSEYRLDVRKDTYFIISDDLTEKRSFVYNENLDSKKDAVDIF